MLRLLVAAMFAFALPSAAFASALVESIKGQVQLGGAPVFQGQRIFPGSTFLTTGPGAQMALRFDDGQQVILHENTQFRLVDFRGDERVVMDLLAGAARVVTGQVARRGEHAFSLRLPQVSIGVRGSADFTVALVNPAYVSVKQGTVLLTNAAGTVPLGAGATASVANSATLAASITPSALPPAASTSLANLGALPASTAGTAGGTSVPAAAAGGVAAEVNVPALIVLGIVAAAVVIAVANDDDEPAATTSH